jgi:hypothetical protein
MSDQENENEDEMLDVIVVDNGAEFYKYDSEIDDDDEKIDDGRIKESR